MRDQRNGPGPPRFGPGMEHYIRKPSLPRPAVPLQAPLIIKPSFEWQKWDELVIRVRGLLPTETTFTVWKNFRSQGNISFIELYENRNGQRDGLAKIRFSPPPHEPFWTQSRPPGTYIMKPGNSARYNVHVSLSNDRRQGLCIQSPIRRQVFYDPKMKLFASTLHFGLMTDPTSMMALHSVHPLEDELTFVVDLLHNRIVANFEVQFRDPRLSGDTDYASTSREGSYNRINKYMFQIPFGQLEKIQRMDLNPQVFALVIRLDSPPQYYRKRQDDTAGHAEGNLLWSEFDTWYRQTDIVYDPYRLQTAKVTLHKERPVIDIGKDSLFASITC
jgi:RNA-dependent RNA polymerase